MRRILKRATSLLVCVFMLLNMMIVSVAAQSGVQAKLYWTDTYDAALWTDAGTDKIFDIKAFEPGASEIRYLKIENTGTSPFEYALELVSENEISALADAVDVYAAMPDGNIGISSMKKVGTLAEVINTAALSEGKILPAGLVGDDYSTEHTIVAVALKMQENAPDQYQGTSVGQFDIKLTATEDRSFGDYPDKFAVKFKNTDKYIYRVGNANPVALGSLFKALDGVTVGKVSVNVVTLDSATDAGGTYTEDTSHWAAGTIKFSGTGPVKVTITDDGKNNTTPVSLNLEVVNATNVTKYSELGNKSSVLLNDITMKDGGSYYLSGATLYGNGFTFDVSKATYQGSGDVSGNYVVGLANAHLDNIKITGAVYTQYGAQAADAYNRAAVLSIGDSSITDSYISNCASPVRIDSGNIEIKNTTLKGGNYANLDIRNGHVVLDNVTTINQVKGNDLADDGTTVVGLGVAIFYENVQGSTITVKNSIKQYNHISKTQADEIFTNSYATSLKEAIFSTDFSSVQYNDGADVWVNTGIVSMMEGIGSNNISNVDGYSGIYETIYSKEGYVYTCIPTQESIAESAPVYSAVKQGEIAPTYSFEYPTEGNKNYLAQAAGTKKRCYYDNGEIRINFDQGGTSEAFDTQILTVSKHGIPLEYTVKLDGAAVSGTTITFNDAAEGSHILEYTYVDNNNYVVGENGSIATYPVEYTKKLTVVATSVAPDAKNASFTFAKNNTATEILEIGGDNYIVPSGITTNSESWGYITVSGQKVFYPITEADITKNIVSKVQAYFYVFKDVIAITDYADGGTGSAVTYNSGTTTLPSGLSVVKGYCGSYSAASSAVKDDSALAQSGPEGTFKYYASSTASSTPITNDNALCYASPGNLNTTGRAESITIAKYRYADNAGKTYYYYVGYHMADQENSGNSSGCLASGSLITLADGSTKKIEEVTYEDELLVWSFIDGEYATVPSALIINDGLDEYTVITLTFDDGNEIRLIDIHGLYDADLNKFVYIDPENAGDYVGHNFVKTSLDGNTTAKLVDYTVTTEYAGCYTIQTAMHVNCVADGFLTQTPPLTEGYFDYFEMGEGMQYDPALMQADIEKYGLYTYEDFEDYLDYEAFIALNGPYLKVAVGKGYFDFDFLIEQIGVFGIGKNTEAEKQPSTEPTDENNEDGEDDDSGIAPMSVEDDELLTDVVISSGNNITAAVYSAEINGENAIKEDDIYTCTSNEAAFTITSGGTATKGYVRITIDGDEYTLPLIGSSTLTVKNAKGKAVRFDTCWGAAEATVTDNVIDLGELTIKAVEKNGTGALVTLLNTTKADKTGDLYIAVYDTQSRLVAVKCAANTVIAANGIPKEVSFDIDIGENSTVKAFIWEPSGVIPLAAAI